MRCSGSEGGRATYVVGGYVAQRQAPHADLAGSVQHQDGDHWSQGRHVLPGHGVRCEPDGPIRRRHIRLQNWQGRSVLPVGGHCRPVCWLLVQRKACCVMTSPPDLCQCSTCVHPVLSVCFHSDLFSLLCVFQLQTCAQAWWWWCRPHPVHEHAQDHIPLLGARPASPPTRQAAQPPPRGPSTNPRPLV